MKTTMNRNFEMRSGIGGMTMKNVAKKSLTLMLAGLFMSPVLIEAASKGTSGGQFLRIGAGARGPAMAGAFGAVADDASAIYWNPGALAKIERKDLQLSYNAYFNDTSAQFAGYAHPTQERGTLAVGVSFFGVKDIEKRSTAGDSDTPDGGTFDTGDMALSLGWGNKRVSMGGHLNYGLALKYISSDLETKKAATGAVDLGVVQQFNDDGMGLSASLAVLNLGGELKFDQEGDPLPLNVKPGLAWKKQLQRLGQLTMALEADLLVNDGSGYVQPGFEWWAHPAFALRGGYQFGRADEAGAGFGVGVGFRLGMMGLDYAFVPYGDLGDTHRASLGVKF